MYWSCTKILRGREIYEICFLRFFFLDNCFLGIYLRYHQYCWGQGSIFLGLSSCLTFFIWKTLDNYAVEVVLTIHQETHLQEGIVKIGEMSVIDGETGLCWLSQDASDNSSAEFSWACQLLYMKLYNTKYAFI